MTKATPRKAPSSVSSSVGDSDNSSSSSDSPDSEGTSVATATDASMAAVDKEDAGQPSVEDVAPPPNSGFVTEDTKTLNDVQAEDSENLAHLGEPKDVEVSFTYLSHLDPRRQADKDGIYHDDIERRDAELARAQAEGREPNLDNPPPTAGTPLVPTVAAATLAPVPGQVVPVDTTATVNVGVPAEAVTSNAAAAEAQGLNPDGSDPNAEPAEEEASV